MPIEALDAIAIVEGHAERPCTMNVNLRAGQQLVLQPEGCEPIVVRFDGKHGNGGRLRVQAVRSVKITPPSD
jgi:hypothetical protein